VWTFITGNASRVTGLGKLSPNGRVFTLGSFFKLQKVPSFCATFFLNIPIFHTQTFGWSTFWAIFSQTHLVTVYSRHTS
jgi:hypothetical protein